VLKRLIGPVMLVVVAVVAMLAIANGIGDGYK
jgi:hypothetical protein